MHEAFLWNLGTCFVLWFRHKSLIFDFSTTLQKDSVTHVANLLSVNLLIVKIPRWILFKNFATFLID